MDGEICTDNRFEIIAAYKKKLIERTNIQSRPEEMAVIDNVLFRFWQMGWLLPIPHGRLIDADALKAEYLVPSTTTNSSCRPYVSIETIKNAPTIIPSEEGE